MADSVDLHPDPLHELLVDLAPESPDLVVGAYSPDFSESSHVESPYFLDTKQRRRNNMGSSIVLSLEEGIHGGEEIKEKPKPSETPEFSLSRQHSLELFPQTISNSKLDSLPVIGINAGSKDGMTTPCGSNFIEDSCFIGGDVIRTDYKVGDGDGDGQALYQTARFGEFCYSFRSLESGKYLIDLLFAEIVFTSGPPGMRLFDVFIQEEKVVSCLDLCGRVGANCPLVISNLNVFVAGDKCLFIRFAKMTGNPTLCGICIRKDLSTKESEPLKITGMSGMPDSKSPKDGCSCSREEKFKELQRDYEDQRKELSETRRVFEKLKRDKELKTKECKEAWFSTRASE